MASVDLFISDLHLCPGRPKVTEAFRNFLTCQAAGESCRLYILGDLFDAWIGDDDDSEFAREVEALLADCVASGCALHILQGNRDFLLGSVFGERTGATLLEEPAIIERGGRRILLLHGDSLCVDDHEYQESRVQMRSPEWQRQILRFSLAERRELAKQARVMSSANSDACVDVSEAAVVEIMEHHRADLLIHGHTHKPGKHEVITDSGTLWRAVLGQWLEHQLWYLRLEGDAWDLIAQNLQPHGAHSALESCAARPEN